MEALAKSPLPSPAVYQDMASEQIVISSWPTLGVGVSAVFGSLCCIAAIFVVIALASRVRKALKAVNLALQLLNIPVTRNPRYH
ncbi:hypothetical protein VTJ49DRAFT_4291 [Mycothermus thermophilus]|uniref:Uncharacterized protein n=1 Tax=Humicola insolens TaxID=85995 RepID=A0ABR3V5P9_HUMIN